VAATVTATAGAWSGSRPLGVILAVPAALLAVATVYCQMHYGIDALAGLATGIGVVAVVRRWDRQG
jgi:membrane-associated phospholipid phosphatase